MYPNIVECFMCTNDYKCSVVNDKIVTQVEYLLPEVTIVKKDIPLRICSICERSLQSFSKFKDVSLENNLRLEAKLKEAQGSISKAAQSCEAQDFEFLIDSAMDESVVSRLKEHKIKDNPLLEKIIKKALISKYSETKACSTSNVQLYPKSVDSDNKFEGSELIERIIKKVINSVVTEKKIATVDKNSRNIEDILIMEETREKTPFDREFYNYLVQNTATEQGVIDNNINCSEANQIDTVYDTEDKYILPAINDQKFKIFLPPEGNIERKEETTLTYGSMDIDLPGHSVDIINVRNTSNTSHQNDTSETNSDKFEEIFIKEELPVEISIDSHDYNNENRTKEFIIDNNVNAVIVDNGKKHFQCDLCLQVFSKKCGLVSHMSAHKRPKYVKCNECNKYIDKKVLVSHFETHSDVRNSYLDKGDWDLDLKCHERRDFQCPTCNKMFKLKSNLATHMKIHTEVKNFKCQICDKLFLLKCNLQDHMEVHNNPI